MVWWHEKEKSMKSLVVRNLKIAFAVALLVSLIGTAIDSTAQDPRARLLQHDARLGQPSHANQLKPTSGPTWSLLVPSYGNPDIYFDVLISEHSAVYDPGSNTMIVFGGLDQNDMVRNTVMLESNANGSAGMEAGTWTEPSLSTFPPARVFHSAVYDQTNNRMIAFGGCADYLCGIPLNDTWVLSNANGQGGALAWTQLSPTGSLPSPRGYHNAVYDATNNRMIVYSGEGAGSVSLSDVWVLSNANGLGGTPAWTQLSPTGSTPDAKDESAAVYDPTTNTMTVFGGYSFVNSVWTLSNANGLTGTPAWKNIIANGAAGAPRARYGAQAIYDPASNRMTIFGGVGDFGPTNPDLDVGMFNDVWVLANANGSGGAPSWTQLHPKFNGDGVMTPGARMWFSTVRDPNTNSMIIFGGIAFEAAYGSPWVLSHANGL
jgi:hypothetical protein